MRKPTWVQDMLPSFHEPLLVGDVVQVKRVDVSEDVSDLLAVEYLGRMGRIISHDPSEDGYDFEVEFLDGTTLNYHYDELEKRP